MMSTRKGLNFCPGPVDARSDADIRRPADRMSTKNLVRTVVVLGLISWPAVETARLWSTNQKLAEAQTLERTVAASLAQARNQHAQMAHTGIADPK